MEGTRLLECSFTLIFCVGTSLQRNRKVRGLRLTLHRGPISDRRVEHGPLQVEDLLQRPVDWIGHAGGRGGEVEGIGGLVVFPCFSLLGGAAWIGPASDETFCWRVETVDGSVVGQLLLCCCMRKLEDSVPRCFPWLLMINVYHSVTPKISGFVPIPLSSWGACAPAAPQGRPAAASPRAPQASRSFCTAGGG